MTRITTGCPRCGRVELEVQDVVLVVSPREESAWYLFDCGGCARRVVKPAPATVANALASVRAEVWTVPAEVLERVDPAERPQIAMDDVLDALIVLGSEADLAGLAAGTAPTPADGPGQAPSGAPSGLSRGTVTNPSSGAAESPRGHPNAA